MKLRVLLIAFVFYFIGFGNAQAKSYDNDSLIISFIKEFELAMQYGNYSFLDSAIYMDSLAGRILIESNDYELRQFNAGFKLGFENSFKLSGEIEKAINDVGLYNYLSYYAKDDSVYHVIYRLFGQQGLNYHNFEVKIIDNKPRIVDLFLYITGENISETIKNNYLSILQQKGLINKLTENELIQLKDLFTIREVRDLYNNGKISKAYKKFNKTSEQFKNSKLYFLYNSLLLAELDEELYLEFLDDYYNMIQDDPFVYLLSIDFLFLKKEYDQLLSNLNILDKAVGGDPLLDLYRGNAYLEMGDINNSLICYTRIKEKYPLYSYGYVGEVYSYLTDNDYETSLKLLNDMMDMFAYSTKDIEMIFEEYTDFLASEEFKVWKKSY